MREVAEVALKALLVAVPLVAGAVDAASPAAAAQAADLSSGYGAERQLPNLTPLNFFTEGWKQAWASDGGFATTRRYTPDMALLRVTTNFMERELRFDYVYTNVAENAKLDNTQLGDALIAYGLNRRLMVEVIGSYQWNVAPNGSTTNGGVGAFYARLQLVDTPGQSYAFQMKLIPPNKGLGQTQTTLGYVLTGWQDVHEIVPALGRCGLYYSFEYDNLQGLAKAGTTRNSISYDVSLAETWTPHETPVLGNFTTFVEFYATTPLDGTANGKTSFWITPAIRFWFLPQNSFTFGVDLQVSHYPTSPEVYRVNYIYNF